MANNAQGDYKKAISLYNERLAISLAHNDSSDISHAYYKIATCFALNNMYDSIVIYMDKSTNYNPNKVKAAERLRMVGNNIRGKGWSFRSYICLL